MGKKIKHFFDSAEEIFKQEQEAFKKLFSNPAEEIFKQEQEALRMATASPLGGELLKQQQEALRMVTASPLGEFLKRQQEAFRMATASPLGEFLKRQQEAFRMATASPLGEFLKRQQEAFRIATASPFGELLKQQQEALRTATANLLGELLKQQQEALRTATASPLGGELLKQQQEALRMVTANSQWYLKTPLYNLSRLESLNPEEFETEEEWFNEIEKIWTSCLEQLLENVNKSSLDIVHYIAIFLEQLLENVNKSSLDIVHYIAIHRLEIFSILLSVYFFTQSASKQDIKVIDQKVDNTQQNVQSLHEKITPPAKINPERNELLENKLNRLIEALEKFQQELGELGKKIPSEEKTTLYKTITSVAVKAEPNTDSATITQLAANEPVKWIAQELDWIQVQFFDYIYWELKTGWIQEQNLELLIPLPADNSEQLTVEQEEITGEQILQVHRQIMEKYQTAFQRLANS
jgi:hypothetical protein